MESNKKKKLAAEVVFAAFPYLHGETRQAGMFVFPFAATREREKLAQHVSHRLIRKGFVFMDEKTKNTVPENEITHQPGEKGFAIFLLLIGLFFTWQSVILYQQAPGASSYGAVPLFCSAAIDILAIAILITDRNKKSMNSGKPLKEAISNMAHHLFRRDIVVMVGLVLLYCVALYMNVGFMIATPIFLWIAMTYLGRGNMVKNLLWTAICMVFIYLVFQILFSVVLP